MALANPPGTKWSQNYYGRFSPTMLNDSVDHAIPSSFVWHEPSKMYIGMLGFIYWTGQYSGYDLYNQGLLWLNPDDPHYGGDFGDENYYTNYIGPHLGGWTSYNWWSATNAQDAKYDTQIDYNSAGVFHTLDESGNLHTCGQAYYGAHYGEDPYPTHWVLCYANYTISAESHWATQYGYAYCSYPYMGQGYGKLLGVWGKSLSQAYVFYTKTYNDGTYSHQLPTYQFWNGTGESFSGETQISPPSATQVQAYEETMVFIPTKVNADVVFMLYLNNGATQHGVGCIVFNDSTKAVLSHTVTNAASYNFTTIRGGSNVAAQIGWPCKIEPKLINGVYYAQCVVGQRLGTARHLVAHLSWTSTTPTITIKTMPTMTAQHGGDLYFPRGWQTLEYNSSTGELYHVFYAIEGKTGAGPTYYPTFWVHAYYNDAKSTNSTWTTRNDIFTTTVSVNVDVNPTALSYPSSTAMSSNESYNSILYISLYGFPFGSMGLGPFGAMYIFINWWASYIYNNLGQVTVGPLAVQVTADLDNFINFAVTCNALFYATADLVVQHGLVADVEYKLLGASSIVDLKVFVISADNCTVSLTDDFVRMDVQVNNPATATVDLLQVYMQDHAQTVMMWDNIYTEQLIDLINAERAGLSLQPIRKMTRSRLGSSEDIAQTQADNMAALDLLASTSGSFPSGYQSFVERLAHTQAGGGTEVVLLRRLKLVYDVNNNSDGNNSYSIINDFTLETPQELYAYAGPLYPSVFLNALNGNTNIYGVLGIALKPAPSHLPTDAYGVWLCFAILDFTGGGAEEPQITPHTTELGLQTNYPYWGTTWHETFIGLMNTKRAALGLPAYHIPTVITYSRHLDVAQQHDIDMAVTGVYEHDSASFPVGWETFVQRASLAGSPNSYGGENIQWRTSSTGDLYTIGDVTMPTPQEVFDSWWVSPGHKANILRNWGKTMVSYMGLYYGNPPTGYVGLPAGAQVFYFTNNFLDLMEKTMEVYLNVNNQFNGALIELLIEDYGVTTYVDVKAAHTAKYSIRVGSAHQAKYGCGVAVQHVAMLMYSMQTAHQAPYVGTVGVKESNRADYRLWATVPVAKAVTALYGASVAAAFDAPYEGSVDLRKALTATYTINYPSAAAHKGAWALTVRAAKDNNAKWDLKTTNIAKTGHNAFWNLMSDTVTISSIVTTLTVNGRDIILSDAVVSQSESAPEWEAEVRLADIDDYAFVSEGDTATLTIDTEDYALVIVGKSLSRSSPVGVDARVSAKSPTVLLGAPYASKGTFKFETAMTAKAIVESILGQSVTWTLVDWTLPAFRVNFENTLPIEAAREIIEAAGGIMQAEKDGTLLVRKWYPVASDKLATTSPDQVFTDSTDNLSVSEDYDSKEGFNRFRIMEGESAFADRMEWVPDEGDKDTGTTGDPTKGILRIYPSPNRTTWKLVNTQDMPSLVMVDNGYVQREETQEDVAFDKGTAGLSYPIDSITSVTWSSESLGGISFEVGSTSLSCATTVNQGYGLADVTYKTTAYEYACTGVLGTSILMLMEDLSEV